MSSSNVYWADCPSDYNELPPIPTEWKQKTIHNNTKKITHKKNTNPFSLLDSHSDSDSE